MTEQSPKIFTYVHTYPDKQQTMLVADLRGPNIEIEATQYIPEFKNEYLEWRTIVVKDIMDKASLEQLTNLSKNKLKEFGKF